MATFIPKDICRQGAVWRLDISFSNQQKETPSQPSPSSCLELLCEEEVNRRFKTSSLSDKQLKKYKYQIGFSAYNGWDLKASIRVGFTPFSTQSYIINHLFEKNSSLNGYTYHGQNNVPIKLTNAITSSSDHSSHEIAMLRRIVTNSEKTVCYAGRPETLNKMYDLTRFIGADAKKSQHNNELPFLVTSLMTTSYFGRFFSREPKLLDQEIDTFQTSLPPISMDNGQSFIPKPILVARQVNFFSRLENILPGFLSGALRAKDVTKAGHAQLFALADNKINQLDSGKDISKKMQISKLVDALKNPTTLLLPEQEILYRDFLCKLLELPMVYHCKSSTDRTGIFVALSSALEQWLSDSGNQELMKDNPVGFLNGLLKNEKFQELFAAHLMIGHQVTAYARGTPLELSLSVNGKPLHPGKIGFAFERGIFQNPCVQRLLPDRFLTRYSFITHDLKPRFNQLRQKYTLLGAAGISILSAIVLVVAMSVSVVVLGVIGLGASIYALSKPKQFKEYFRPFLFITPFLKLHRLFPEKVINEEHPLLKEMRFIK